MTRPVLPISYEHTQISYRGAKVPSPTQGDKTELLESPGVREKEGALPSSGIFRQDLSRLCQC